MSMAAESRSFGESVLNQGRTSISQHRSSPADEDRRRDGTGGRRRGCPFRAGLRATGAVVLGHGVAEAQGAGERHMHIYDAKYPTDPKATLKPADALVADYKLLQKRIGTSRNVVVTPSTYGTDNRVTLDAIAQIGPTARGVAVVDATVTDAELKRLNGLGIRGIRFNLVQAGATTAEMIEPLSRRVNDLGWHIQIHMKGEQIAGIEDLLLRVPSPIVFDHLGRLAQPNALDNPGFKTISKLIDKGRTWVKLSGAYQDSKVGPPSYSDM